MTQALMRQVEETSNSSKETRWIRVRDLSKSREIVVSFSNAQLGVKLVNARIEGKNKDGSPNGQYWMDEAGARAASGEVLATHKGLTGAALSEYLNTYFAKAWSHFDVNKTGKVEVIKMP